MERREFLALAAATTLSASLAPRSATGAILPDSAQSGSQTASGTTPQPGLQPMELGLVIKPFPDPEQVFQRTHDLGFRACFLSLDAYLGHFTPELVTQFRSLLKQYGLTATTVEVVDPKPLEWNFLQGPSTIGLVPPQYRVARIDALRQVSDFAHALGIPQVQTHCGFIPEDPADPLYPQTVAAIREVARHCESNGQQFLMETGQETPTTMSRALRDVNQANLGVGLDTANLILYGKANPVDAVTILGPHVRSIHAKDGRWPTNPSDLGEEVLIGKGDVNFAAVLTALHRLGYAGAVSIERETEGPQQIADVRAEKRYLEDILNPLRG